jgi:hypothetical protein
LPILRDNPEAGEHGLPYLVVKLKPGWRWSGTGGECESSRGRRLALLSTLPPGVSIEAAVPALARTPITTLSREEQRLARYLHVIFPPGLQPAAYADSLRRHPCIEEVTLSTPATLP